MPVLKVRGGASVQLVTLVVLVAICQPALADTTTLICSVAGAAGPATIELSEAAGSITVYTPPVPNPGGRPDPIPGMLMGTYAASFTPNAITFVMLPSDIGTVEVQATLNRLTGILDWYYPSDRRHYTWTCHLGQKQF
jgi:hypothetical protein